MKHALLDTDFISKTYAVRAEDGNRLIDRVLEMPGYSFACHEQTAAELNRYDSGVALWLEQEINFGLIEGYTDERILNEMTGIYNRLAPYQYTNMTKVACDAFDSGYFDAHYFELESLDYGLISVFLRLHMERKCSAETAKSYIEALLGYYEVYGQKNIRVIEASKTGRYLRVPCEQVLKDIFENKFEELRNGMLKYRLK